MNKKRLLTIISFIFSLTITACNSTSGNKTNDLELIYFGKKEENQQQEKVLSKKPYYLKNESADDETLDNGITNLSYGENFVVEAQVKNEKRFSFVDIVISSGSTNQKYVYNEGHGKYQCETTTVFRDDMWITDITIPIDFSLIDKDTDAYRCFIDTSLEVEEITFLNLSGSDAKANIKSDVKKLPIKAEGPIDNHLWEANKLEDGTINVECASCHKNQYGLQIDTTNKVIKYGAYPQTVVSDDNTIAELDNLDEPFLNDWYYYRGFFYTKLTADPFKPNYVFDNGATILNGTTYWFRCEPIIWNILSDNNGGFFLLSSVLLDAHRYAASESNYKNAEIRSWLNNEFYNSAFCLDSNCVETTDVDNSASTTDSINNKYACENTQDKVFLLSYQDYLSKEYGFTSLTGPTKLRECKTTDWARARGTSHSTSPDNFNNGYYWTRSPVRCVSVDGDMHYDYLITDPYCSVRPAITLSIAE